jgi:hypothetical protein
LECGELVYPERSGAEGLPLFFRATTIPDSKLSKTAKIALFRINDLRNAIFVTPFF